MKITTRSENGVFVFKIEGDCTTDYPAGEMPFDVLMNKARRAIQTGARGILLDVEKVGHYEPASFLGEIAEVSHACDKKSVRFGLLKPTDKVGRLLETTGVGKAILVFDNEDEATELFSRGVRKPPSVGSLEGPNPDEERFSDGH